ncbi:MAG: glycosyltransferase family 4 protein [Candidatus Eisenbacteria bacterium]|uniref:Glycosyltransferase family 4 protein n=1 Tax=Eiseniibacteriota bacterium TaxID=2212470 RepID=A0A538TYM5_UNCEI|nr:MAG: glycosyltransferase family 4 protein [Candidatus Eisenbacteria bacterium]
MRILILHNRYREFGGEDAVVDAEMALLRSAGLDVYSLSWTNDDVRANGPLGGSASLATAVWNRSAWHSVRRAVCEFRPDVVHVHNTLAAASPSVVHGAALPGVGLVHTLHNFRHLCLNGVLLRNQRVCTDCVGKLPWRGVVRACYRGSRAASMGVACSEVVHRALGSWSRVHRMIALSEHAKRLHVQAGFDERKITVKPQTLSTDPGMGEHGGDFALFAGRLSAEKGILVLLRAWREAQLEVPLVIAGDGPEAERVRGEIADLPAAKMLGRIDRASLLDLMHQTRLLIVPSLCFEGFPITLLEGLATGCPIVASDIGALGEIIRSGENGVLVPLGDGAALARAIQRLNDEPAERERLSRAARASFVERFTPERSCQALVNIYRDACAEARTEN